jgi:hypothetical protein
VWCVLCSFSKAGGAVWYAIRFPEEFAAVPHTWAMSERDICLQYLTLLRRVRKVAGCKPSHRLALIRSKFKWLAIVGYGVRSLWVLPGARMLVQGMAFQFGRDARQDKAEMQTCKKIASHISVYLGSLDAATLPQEAFLTSRISPSTLHPLRRSRLTVKGKLQGTLGSLGTVPWDHLGDGARPTRRARVVVVVEQIHRTVDIAGVSTSLDMCSFFAQGDGKHNVAPAWHAARVHHRCRLLYPPDAPPDLRTARV